MTNLFDRTPLHPKSLSAGEVVYYATPHAVGTESLHLLQVTKVMVSNQNAFILDNGERFNTDTGEEIRRGTSKGALFPYNATTSALVKEAQDKLFLVNEVLSINFTALTTQQLSMIRDVARGAFTQVSLPTPCNGGCKDTVQVAGLDIEINQAPTDVLAPIAFTDASYELTEAELDDIEDADEDDDHRSLDYLAEDLDDEELEDRCASGHTA